MDPNEGFGRNLKPLPLKSREEREAEGGETYSDDDGGLGWLMGNAVVACCGCMLRLHAVLWLHDVAACCGCMGFAVSCMGP